MIDYIRFEAARRHHVVFIDVAGAIFATVCGRLVAMKDVSSRSYSPTRVCQCCRSRVAKPHLIPDWLTKTKEAVDHASAAR